MRVSGTAAALAAMTLAAVAGACGRAQPSTTTAAGATPAPVLPAPATIAELTALGEQIIVRHPEYGYYVSCVNLPENGAWAPPPAPVDYSACPITDELRSRMQLTRADFVQAQNPFRGRTVAVTPQPGGGLVVDTLDYQPVIKLEMVAVRAGDRVLIGDVVAKGDVTGPDPPPVDIVEKPSPTPAPSASPAPTSEAGRTRTLAVPWYRQVFGLSCEEASLRMALAFEDIATTDAAILDIIGTDQRPAYRDASALRWGNPYRVFVGNPNGSEVALTGYGTYHPAIVRAAGALGGRVLRSGEGVAPADLYAAILAGHPAVVWVTYRWVSSARQDYTAFDGQRIPYAGPVEHAVTAAGVGPSAILINDPLLGRSWVPKATFEAAYATYNQMAVILA